jgi:hypothetical protein
VPVPYTSELKVSLADWYLFAALHRAYVISKRFENVCGILLKVIVAVAVDKVVDAISTPTFDNVWT